MPEHIEYWGIPDQWGSPNILVYTVMFLAGAILILRFFLRARLWWKIGRPEPRWNKLHIRLYNLIKYAIVQTRLLRQKYPGIMHIALAWSFFIFFLGTALATINTHFIHFLKGNVFSFYKLTLDLFTVVFIVGAVLAIYRRYVTKPDRLTYGPQFTWTLVLLIIIVLGGITTESLRLAVEQPVNIAWSPIGGLLAQGFLATGASDTALTNLHLWVWLVHLLTAAFTIITLPVGSLLHVLTGPMNIFFTELDRPVGQLSPTPTDREGQPVYVSKLNELSWKQILNGDACTECGRCQDVCPAFAAGYPLNPKELILGIREIFESSKSSNGKSVDQSLLENSKLSKEVLWSCTTCAACITECPVLVDHIDTIVEIRRHLVIEGQIDSELQDALTNLGRYGNSFGQSPRKRAKWTEGFEPPIKDATREPVEYLWFVGDYASYNPALAEMTAKTAKVFNQVGLDFGVMYKGENHAGNDVRRVGEEGLFEMLVEKNLSALQRCNYQTIVTTDPHTYNTLLNEYPFSEPQNILHYSQLLAKLIKDGKLQFSNPLNYRVTYHDPCYLGRYNGIYDDPRFVIKATGCELVEMPRNKNLALCCGAGGGRIWMEEGKVQERPSESRIREAAELAGVQQFIVSCPKDITMYKDAVKTTGHETDLVVKDLIELVLEAL
jgi:Fe-S oxidoreductase/nitrate reductase gamma subunit